MNGNLAHVGHVVSKIIFGDLSSAKCFIFYGAACVTRTRDPIITNDVLYQLS